MLSATLLSFSRKISPLVLRNLQSEFSLKSVRRLSKGFKMNESAPWLNIEDTDSKGSTSEKKQEKVNKKTPNNPNNKGANGTKEKQRKLQVSTNKKNADSRKGKDSDQAIAAGVASSSSAKKEHVMTTEDIQQTSSDDDFEICPEPETGTPNLEVDGSNISTKNSGIIHAVSSSCANTPSAASTNNEEFMECEETTLKTETKSSDTTKSSCENQASTTSPQSAADEQSSPEIKSSKKKKKKKKKKDNNAENTEVKQQKLEATEETGRKSEKSLDSANIVAAALAKEKSLAATTVAKMECEDPNTVDQQQMEGETSPDLSSTCGAVEATTANRAPIGNQPIDQTDCKQAEVVKCPSGSSNSSNENHAEAPDLPSTAAETTPVKHAETPAVKEECAMDCSEVPQIRTNKMEESHLPGGGENSSKCKLQLSEGAFIWPESDSMAVCIAQDFNMKNSTLKMFRDKIGHIKQLRAQGKQVGDVAVWREKGQNIYYLITKEQTAHKMALRNLTGALKALKKRCEEDKVTKLSMPWISDRPDELGCKQVMGQLRNIFNDTSLTITVYDEQQQTSPHQPSHEGDKKQGQTADNHTADAKASHGGEKQNYASGSNSSGKDRASSRSRDNQPTAISKSTPKATPSNKRQDDWSTHTAPGHRRQEKESTEAFPQNWRDGVPFDPRSKPRIAGPCSAYQGFQLREVQDDLFTCPETDSMALGISQDFYIRKGIAKRLKEKYGRVGSLKAQERRVGEVAVLPVNRRYIYYLITKDKSDAKPSYEALRSSLEAMRNHCLTHRVTNISMPRIECGRHKLEWGRVAQIVEDVFKKTPIIITVYERIPVAPEGFVLDEVEGDLFQCSPSDSMAHCVSQDLHMGKGIAVLFRDYYGGVPQLRAQGKQVGDVAVLPWEGAFIYYLITKENHFDKPTYETLQSSLEAMRKHCQENKVTRIAMPQIGCGLDGLEWYDVRYVLCEVFRNTGITITVYIL